MAKYNQGVFKPMNPRKCKNPPNRPIVFRSSWEAMLFKWCDRNTNVVEWSSEQLRIPYLHPMNRTMHIYVPDVWIKVIESNGKMIEKVIEVKPLSETPAFAMARFKETGRKPSAYRQGVLLVNNAKFKSAEQWCKAHNMEFVIMTENEIKAPRRVITKKTNREIVRGKRKPKRSQFTSM